MPRKPNFFIVGAPKCGTTAMDTYLSRHPDIFMGLKERHFFTPDLIRIEERNLPLEVYEGLFEDARDQAVVGECSVFYLLSREAARNIHAYCPEAKILVMVRNPLQVLEAHHTQLVYEGDEDIEDFVAAYDASPRRRSGDGIPDGCQYRDILDYPGIVAYADQIQRYLEVFGPGQVHVEVFDDFVADTAACYRRVLAFLGVDPEFRPAFPVINARKTTRNRAVLRFLRNTPDWVTVISRIFLTKRMRYEIKEWLERRNTKAKKPIPLPADFRARLAEDCRPEVEKLGRLLNRDLSHWVAG